MRVVRLAEESAAFRVTGAGRDFHFAPGWIARQRSAALVEAGAAALREWESAGQAPFAPECLTLNLTDKCNLTCSYCYSQAGRGSATISPAALEAAARLVARHCADSGKPFHLVLHGGGEPTLAWDLLRHATAYTKALAAGQNLEWFGYIATNGTLAEERAEWLGREFSLVGLSCDGPAEFQGSFRAFSDARDSIPAAIRTARAVGRVGGRLSVRATIRPPALRRQRELVVWLHERLAATDLRFEPEYAPFNALHAPFQERDAAWFVHEFLSAQREARLRGCTLQLSGVRFDELHSAYCNPLRNVLQVLPSGEASLCSFAYDEPMPMLGRYDAALDSFVLDHENIRAWQQALRRIPEPCHGCINMLHCTRDCPEKCLLVPGDSPPVGGFRCRTNLLVAHAWLRAATAPDQAAILDGVERELQHAPRAVNTSAIRDGLEAALRAYPFGGRRQPQPVWAQRGLEHAPGEAFKTVDCSYAADAAISVYVHVPFCDRLCGGCDCHAIGGRGAEERDQYLDALAREIRLWTTRPGLQRRPVTTVHFGGGTPTELRPDGLARAVDQIRAAFGTTPETEWALETTTSHLTPEYFDRFEQLGIRRLHVGLQSLEPAARAFFGRRESAERALDRVVDTLARNFILTADLVYGLPGETLAGWVSTLERLVGAGIHGLSLYHFNVTSRNARYVGIQGAAQPPPVRSYVFFQVAHQLLAAHGFRKNHFAHFARPSDGNLYYRHAARGEDLLALGPAADGIFGDYRYRHHEYPEWAQAIGDSPGLQGGLRETKTESQLRRPAAALMAGSIPADELRTRGLGDLMDRWIVDGLLTRAGSSPELLLTANGSWFIGPMLEELHAVA